MNPSGFPNSFRRPVGRSQQLHEAEFRLLSQQLEEAEQRQLLQQRIAREQALRDVVASQALSSLQQSNQVARLPSWLTSSSQQSSPASGLGGGSSYVNNKNSAVGVALEEARKAQELHQLQSLLASAVASSSSTLPVQASSDQQLLLRQLQGHQQFMLPTSYNPHAIATDRFLQAMSHPKRQREDHHVDEFAYKKQRLSFSNNSFPLPPLEEKESKRNPLPRLESYRVLWDQLKGSNYQEEVFKRRLHRNQVNIRRSKVYKVSDF